MLKQFSAAIFPAVFISATAFAAPYQTSEKIIREVTISTGFTKIIVLGNADVVLTADQSMKALIEGNTAAVNNITIINQNNVLIIQGNKSSRTARPVIKIPVQRLEMLEVNGDGRVESVNTLPAEHLTITINGACNIAVSVTGRISVEAADGFEYTYLKNEKIKIIRAAN
jgi:hypothetical protein